MDRNYDSNQDYGQLGICKYQGHISRYSHICTYKLCDITRRCCQQCLKDGIHNHSMPNNDHIMDWEQFLDNILDDHRNFQIQFSNNQEAINKEQFLWQLFKNLQKLRKEIEAIEKNVEIYLNMLTSKNIYPFYDNPSQYQNKLDIETLNRWIRNQLDFEVEQLQAPLEQIQQQINKALQNTKQFLENKPCCTLKSRKHKIQIFLANSTILSNNEKYLICHKENTIQVYDIRSNKISKQIFQTNLIRDYQIPFAQDSQCLFVGDSQGFVYGFFKQKCFKQLYKKKIHQDSIQQIKIIQKQILTFSKDGYMIKTDFLTRCCTFKYEIQNHSVYKIFDYDPLKDILISASRQTIEIWDCQNQSLLINQVSGKNQFFKQAQFVKNKQNILCLDNHGYLFEYKIDYQNIQLVKIDEYCDNNKIVGFEQFNNDENLLLIFAQCCRIFNNAGELVSTIYHFLNFEENDLLRTSLHSPNYIALCSSRRLIEELYLIKALK